MSSRGRGVVGISQGKQPKGEQLTTRWLITNVCEQNWDSDLEMITVRTQSPERPQPNGKNGSRIHQQVES